MNFKKIILLVTAFYLQQLLLGQGCVDSTSNMSIKIQTINPILLYSGVTSDSSNLFWGIDYVFKKKDNNIIWAKGIKTPNLYKLYGDYITLNNNTIHLFSIKSTNTINDFGLLKLDNAGNQKWSKKIFYNTPLPLPYTTQFNPSIGKNGDIIEIALEQNINHSFLLALIDSNTQQKWAKQYSLNLNADTYTKNAIAILGDNNIYLFILEYEEIGSSEFANYYLMAFKIDYNTGNILSKKKYQLNDVWKYKINQFNITRNGSLKIGNIRYIKSINKIILGDNARFYGIKMDTNLNIEKYKVFRYDTSNMFFSNHSLITDLSNTGDFFCGMFRDTTIGFNRTTTKKVYFFNFDKQFKIFFEGRYDVSNIGITNPNLFTVGSHITPKGNTELFYGGVDSTCYIQQINPNYLDKDNCNGSKTELIIEEEPGVTELTFPNYSISPFTFYTQDYPLVLNNISLNNTSSFCKTINNCNNLEIIGTPSLCITNPIATYNARKNVGCYRKINWDIDTSIIKIISQTDSTITLKFISANTFFIKAHLEGCVVADSISVLVSNLHNPVSLISDTILCPNSTILLKAQNGFKSYVWQDGSILSSFLVADTGKYYITATDSCNIVTSDTVNVKPVLYNFSIDFPVETCIEDTAIIKLPTVLTNYTFSPNTLGYIQDNYLKLFPQKTTLYKVSGEIFKGCFLSDTVLIKKLDCSTKFQLPNAFSPNNDGINDYWGFIKTENFSLTNLKIFDRYGQQVFSTINPMFRWNGKWQDKTLPIGVYYWILIGRDFYSLEHKYTGTITLLR